jgi:hypothetical protein
LAAQLGEVKAICGLLNAAKINALDGIRRLRVGEDDKSGPATDYLDLPGFTNDLAVSVPYEVTFRCFTPELAGVLAGFANSEYGLIVKGMNLEVAPAPLMSDTPNSPVAVAVPGAPAGDIRSRGGEGEVFRNRYGTRGGGAGYPTPQPAPTPMPMAVGTAAARTGLQPFLSEKQLKVTLLLHVVKLLPST